PRLGPLLGPDTAVVTAQNGIPWWYFERHGGPLDGTRLRTVDPGGVIAEHIEARRIVGCVVYPATSLVGPGVVEHVEGTRLSLGGGRWGPTRRRCCRTWRAGGRSRSRRWSERSWRSPISCGSPSPTSGPSTPAPGSSTRVAGVAEAPTLAWARRGRTSPSG